MDERCSHFARKRRARNELRPAYIKAVERNLDGLLLFANASVFRRSKAATRELKLVLL